MKALVVVSIIIILLLPLTSKRIHAQEEDFAQYNQKLTQLSYEKIYLHTDRNIYSIREDIWFKIYLLDGRTHVPMTGVNTVYVDLVDPLGKVIIHKPFPIENGTGNGNYYIADSLETGTYTIYAYTNYLRNLGIESIFSKEITISQIHLDTDKQVDIEQNDTLSGLQIRDPGILLQFMPEGGYLSVGLPNTLAFKITTINGMGANLKGVVMDNMGNIVDSLQGNHLGMGKIIFGPRPNIGYHAILDDHPYDISPLPPAYRLPQFRFNGIKDNLVQFSINNPSLYDRDGTYYVAFTARGKVLFYTEKYISGARNIINIQLDKFQPGLNQAVLLDSSFMPLAERLFFIPGVTTAAMNIELSRETYERRDRTEVRLQLLNGEDISTGGNFSMSVINLDQIGISEIPLDNIVSYLELSSEIRGHIENPGYYFSQPYDSVKEDLDILLLTQGWTKYIWDDKYVTALPVLKHENESALTVEGHVRRYFSRRARDEGIVSLLIPEENIFLQTTTESDGYYHFDNIILFDSTKIAVQSRNKNDRRNTRLIDVNYPIITPPAFPESDPLLLTNAELGAYDKKAYQRYISNSYFDYDKSTILIEEVTVFEDKRMEDDGHFRIYSEPTHVIDMDDHSDLGHWDVWTFLQGRVPGLRFTVEDVYSNRVPATSAVDTTTGKPTGMLIYLDGRESSFEMVSSIPMQDIDKIEILNDAFSMTAFGMSGANGVISIFTKKGESVYREFPVFDIITKTIEGYARTKEFYMPDYENPQRDPAIIDHRATIFWAPNMTPDSTGTCTISYFNSDDAGRVAIIAEGILNNGKPGVANAFYTVERE